MPKGPKGQKRPADVISNAVLVMRIATGEVEEAEESSASSAARELGKKGGEARSRALTPDRRAEIGRKAAKARWKRD
jgi:hypothetical protein